MFGSILKISKTEWYTKDMDQEEICKTDLLDDWLNLKETNPGYCQEQNDYWEKENIKKEERAREKRQEQWERDAVQRELDAIQAGSSWLSRILAWRPCI